MTEEIPLLKTGVRREPLRMFLRLSPAQSTGVHGWGLNLKTTLTWTDVEDREDINLDLLLGLGIRPQDLARIQPCVRKWVLHAGANPGHAKEMLAWPAHPLKDLQGELSDVIMLKATSKQLKVMGVTYADLKEVGMTPETMRLLSLSFQGWIDMGLTMEDASRDFTDAQLGRVFNLTRLAVMTSFRGAR